MSGTGNNKNNSGSNPFLKPSSNRASLFGGSVSTSGSDKKAAAVSSTKSTASVSAIPGLSAIAAPSLFGGSSVFGAATTSQATAPISSGSPYSIFGSKPSNPTVPVKSSLFGGTENKSFGVTRPSLFSGVLGSSKNKHSLFGNTADFGSSQAITSFGDISSKDLPSISQSSVVPSIPVSQTEDILPDLISNDNLVGSTYFTEPQIPPIVTSNIIPINDTSVRREENLFSKPYDSNSFFENAKSTIKSHFSKSESIESDSPSVNTLSNIGLNAKDKPSGSVLKASVFGDTKPSSVGLFGQFPAQSTDILSSVVHSTESFAVPKRSTQSFIQTTEDVLSSITSSKKSPPLSIEKAEPTAIIAANIHDDYLHSNILKNHFGKFGTTVRVTLHPKAHQAQVTFVSHESAALAKKHGKILHPNIPPMLIFFATAKRARPENSPTDSITQKKNNAIRFLRQNSSENQDRLKRTRKPSFESKLKSKSDVSREKESRTLRRDIPSGLESYISKSKKTRSRPSTPEQQQVQQSQSASKPSSTVSAKDISALYQTRAMNNQDRYEQLIKRDKIIRKQTKKEIDVQKCEYLSATCPDMCPEKERYMREVQYDLSPYETTDDRKVDHKKAVKKFSRSSADKDEPLPHELRTGPVLKLTMDYLLCTIAPELENASNCDLDLCYNYLWDRTRAMRCDIMQQHLLNKHAVHVYERCVRFHIFSSERLCEEQPDVFDPKMNTEHLSKSLHSLKELYLDLAQNDEYFDTESEFRGYEILFNIDDGNIMVSYLMFRDSVRQSPDVQFAIKVLHAYQSHHYVRFFKLLEDATFLQACIMHRYFGTVRSQALKILVKSLNGPGKSQSMSIDTIVRLLKFENIREANLFLESHGLSTSTSGRVLMDRTFFIYVPDEPRPPCRAIYVIGKKKYRSVAKELNGGVAPINPMPNHILQDSFSPDGYLDKNNNNSPKYVEAVPRKVKPEITAPIKVEPSILEDTSIYEQMQQLEPQEVTQSIDKSSDDDLETDVILEFKHKINLRLLKECFNKWRSDAKLCREAIKVLKDKAQYELVEELRLQASLKLRAESLLKLVQYKLQEKYFSSWRKHTAYVIETREIRAKYLVKRAFKKWNKFTVNRIVFRYLRDYVREGLLDDTVARCAHTWLWSTRVSKNVRIIQHRRCQRIQLKCFKKWVSYAKEKVWQNKMLLEGFPACASRLSLPEQNKIWHFECGNIKRSYRDLYELEENIEMKRVKSEIVLTLSHEINSAMLPLTSSFQKIIDFEELSSSQLNTFTLVVCFSDDLDVALKNWIRLKIENSKRREVKPIDFSCSFMSIFDQTITIKLVESSRSELPNVEGVTAILFVSSSISDREDLNFLKNVSPVFERFHISKTNYMTPQLSSNLMQAVLDLYKRAARRFKLKVCSLRQLVTRQLSKHVLGVIDETEQTTEQLHLASLPLKAYCYLHNSALEHLSVVINNNTTHRWRDSSSGATRVMDGSLCRQASRVLQMCNLHPVSPPNYSDIEQYTLAQATDELILYIAAVLGTTQQDHHYIGLLQDIGWKMSRVRNSTMNDTNDSYIDIKHWQRSLPWKDIFSSLVAFKVSSIPDMDVLYCDTDIESYEVSSKWSMPYLKSAINASRHKRKDLECPSTKTPIKKVKRESLLLRNLALEREKTRALEDHLTNLLDQSDQPLVDLFQEQEVESERVRQARRAEPPAPTLRGGLTRERELQDSLEERLRAIL